ncbi:MAG: PAS domain-containing protein, partial [Myxococcales bacterium]|nr:PAS domain-containing protein [Myxococcales bacterium]
MLDALDDAVCIEDAGGIIQECNSAFCDLLSAQRAELIGAHGSSLRHRFADTWEVQRREFVADDGAQRTLVRLRDRSRELAKEEALATRAKELEQNERKLAEILSRQRSVQHAQRLESVGQLTGGVAHDFNNLLAVITGCLELLKVRAGENRPVIELADRALTAAERGAALVQRLLAFSRRQMLNPEPTDVNSLVTDVLELSRRSLGEHIEIETQLCGDLWPVLVDASQLENAILNLVINARDAM